MSSGRNDFFQVPGRRQMEGFLGRQQKPELAHLTDPFAERMVALAKMVGSAVRTELGLMSLRPAGEGLGGGEGRNPKSQAPNCKQIESTNLE